MACVDTTAIFWMERGEGEGGRERKRERETDLSVLSKDFITAARFLVFCRL